MASEEFERQFVVTGESCSNKLKSMEQKLLSNEENYIVKQL